MTSRPASPFCDLDLPKPERISLHQALLVQCGCIEPMFETLFRAIESMPLPDNLDEKRRLIVALAGGRIRHKGELWRMRQAMCGESLSDQSSEQQIKLIDNEYSAAMQLWSGKNVSFATSELRLAEPPPEFAVDRVPADSFVLKNIVVMVEDLENLRPIAKPKGNGGRPPKSAALIKVSAHLSAYIHHNNTAPRHQLVAVLQNYSTELPEEERLCKTMIGQIVGEQLKQIAEFDEEPGARLVISKSGKPA